MPVYRFADVASQQCKRNIFHKVDLCHQQLVDTNAHSARYHASSFVATILILLDVEFGAKVEQKPHSE